MKTYPVGTDGCFNVGISGGCGEDCFVYKAGDCLEAKEISGTCEFYPEPDTGCVCDRGSDVSGKFTCTEEYSKSCQWAVEGRRSGS